MTYVFRRAWRAAARMLLPFRRRSETTEDPKHLLRQFLVRHKGSYVISITSIVLAAAAMVQFPRILGQFTNVLHAGQLTRASVARFSVELFAIGVGYVLLYGVGQFRHGQLGRKFEYELRDRLFDQWERLSTAYFRQRSIGDLLNHAMNDVRAVRESISGSLNILANAVFLLGATLFMTFRTISIPLTLASMIPLLFIPAFIIWWGPRTRVASRLVQEALSNMADLTEESLSAIRLIKATANEPVEVHRFERRVDEIVHRQMGMFRQSALFQSMIPFMGSLSFAIALLYGGNLTLQHQISLGSFVAFTLYLAMLITPLQQIGFVTNNFQRAAASLERLGVLLAEPATIVDPVRPVDPAVIQGEIVMRLPAFTYADASRPTLQQIEFRVPAGHTVGIVGRTGSGKTTLVNLLPRMFDPPPGTVFIDGIDVRDYRLQTLRQAIAYVPQDGFLFSATVRENIEFGKTGATADEIEQAARDAAIVAEIRAFTDGFETLVGERGVTLSGGQKQRTAIARALIKDAPILILDDSLSAVDMAAEKRILRRVRQRRRGRTTLLIAHRLSVVRHADSILVLDEGRLVEQGTHDDLLAAQGLYADLYALQADGEESHE